MMSYRIKSAFAICLLFLSNTIAHVHASDNDLSVLKGELTHIELNLKANPTDENLHLQRAQTLARLHQFDKLLSEVDSLIKINPRSQNAYFFRAHAYVNLNRYADALKALDEAEKIGALPVKYSLKKALYLQELKEYSKAITVLDQVIAKNLNEVDAYFSRAACWHALKKSSPQELKDLRMVVQLDPTNQEAKALLSGFSPN